jgi:hypothetical protein
LNAKALLGHFPAPSRQNLDAALARAVEIALPELAKGSTTKKTSEYIGLARETAQDVRAGNSKWEAWVKLAKTEPEVKLRSVAQPVTEAAGRYAVHPRLRGDVASYLDAVFTLAARALDA